MRDWGSAQRGAMQMQSVTGDHTLLAMEPV